MDRIEIPNADVPHQAANIVYTYTKQAGLDPNRAIRNLMYQALVRAFINGEFDAAKFKHACRNLGILNPALLSA